MQQNHRNRAKLLHEFQFQTQPEICQKQVSHKSATKIFSQPNICQKIPLAGQMTVKNSAGRSTSHVHNWGRLQNIHNFTEK